MVGERYDDVCTERSAQLTAGQWVLEHTEDGARLLDIGCGTGYPSTAQFADAGRDVVAVDNSERMLAIARLRLPKVEFLHRDLRSLPAEPRSFDGAVAFFSLMTLAKRDIEATLAHISRLLVPGGPFALGMVEGDLDAASLPMFGTEVTVSAYSRDSLVEVVRAAGFTVAGVDAVEAELEPGRPETQLYLLAQALS
jgi:ubiquinone/menaquinone biosynthesis C-methylase UbiE